LVVLDFMDTDGRAQRVCKMNVIIYITFGCIILKLST